MSLGWWWWLFPCVRKFWENVRQFIPRLCYFFFCKVEMRSRTLIPLRRPKSVHSGSASWDDCGRVFPDELRVSLFPDRFPRYAYIAAWSAHPDFVGSRVYACLGVLCHRHFWQNDRGLLRATAVTRWWNGHRIKSTHKVNSGEENSPRRSCRDSNSQSFGSLARRSYQPTRYPSSPMTLRWSLSLNGTERDLHV